MIMAFIAAEEIAAAQIGKNELCRQSIVNTHLIAAERVSTSQNETGFLVIAGSPEPEMRRPIFRSDRLSRPILHGARVSHRLSGDLSGDVVNFVVHTST